MGAGSHRGTPVCVLVGLWVANRRETPIAPNSSASQRWWGQTSLHARGGLPPEGCQGNHGCMSPQLFAPSPWRLRDGGSRGNRTGGPHRGLWETPAAPMPTTGGGGGWLGDQFADCKTMFKCQFLLSSSWVIPPPFRQSVPLLFPVPGLYFMLAQC